ncbi:MAG: cytochrome b N-terminal domain-containing protein [Candidatus Eremiobacteraeota bacterium]|nr:cytochrome b N-terminal domain-containing protein [Candidatus Eremiobacteraeota bacterium]
MTNVIKWIEGRTGLVSALKDFLTEDIPGGATYWYVWGSATLIVFTIQVVTGIILTFYYSPSAATAWKSTAFIYQHVYGGQFLLSLHFWGASAMIVLVSIHLLQVLVFGAYKRPREVQWVVGVTLFFFTLSMGLTGYLLPWDLNAYFATQVAINIAASVPIIGQQTAYFLNDGATLGTLTVGRFYGLHVWATPALLIGLIGLHLFIFRHNGPAGPAQDEHPKTTGRFYPDQIFMDTVIAFISFLVIVALAWYMPAPLLAEADPNNATFTPAPAWYFYALYGLLRIAPAVAAFFRLPLEFVNLAATVVLPGVFALVLVALPWLDRNPSRAVLKRPFMLAITGISIIAIIWLTKYSADAIGAEQKLNPAGQTPVLGYGAPPQTPAPASTAVVTGNAAAPDGAKIYSTNCASCHGANGTGLPGAFPPLAGNPVVTGDPNKVIDIVDNGLHGVVKVNGQSYNGVMPSWKSSLKPADISAVITYIRSSWGNSAPAVTEAQVKAHK